MRNFEFHEAANLFPLLEGDEFGDLVADIREHGLREPICLHNDQIVDGRNRYLACREAGLDPKFKEVSPESPISFVVSMNLMRRHLTPGQGASAATEALPFYEKEAKERQRASGAPKGQKGGTRVSARMREPLEGKASEKASEDFGVSPRYVEDAKEIMESDPEAFKKLQNGEETVSKAKRKRSRKKKVAQLKAQVTGKGQWALVTMSDPPWQYGFSETDGRKVENQYPTMTVEEICDYPSKCGAGEPPKDSILLLWATAPKLQEALKVLEFWGFEYVTHAKWDKQTLGMGYWFRGQHELLLVGKRGTFPPPEPEHRVGSIISEKRAGHSVKPQIVYDLAERSWPGVAKAEMFARRAHVGWEGCGAEYPAREVPA